MTSPRAHPWDVAWHGIAQIRLFCATRYKPSSSAEGSAYSAIWLNKTNWPEPSGTRRARRRFCRVSALVLDAGALVAVDRGDRAMIARLHVAQEHGLDLRSNAMVVIARG